MAPSPEPRAQDVVRIAAVGDLLLACGAAGTDAPRDPAATLEAVRPIFEGCDLVFGNLECTLPGSGGTVPTEPRVIAAPDVVRGVLAAGGFRVVSLANNHTFDCLDDGFHALRRLLDSLGIAHCGAGDTLDEAAAPAIVEACGRRVAFLAAADERSGTGRFAAAGRAGVAPFDLERLTDQVRRLRREVDHVIVSPHWGEERFLIPSPTQVRQARALAEAGAALVLGHHPHVIQGMERRQGAAILYSLGNFVACEVPFSTGDRVTWNRTGRTGCVLLADLGPGGVESVRQVATYDDGRQVVPDGSGFGDRRIARANRAVARGVTPGRYRWEHLVVKTIRPALAHLRWSKLRRLRWNQVRNALAGLFRGGQAE